jgi:transposase-like protein
MVLAPSPRKVRMQLGKLVEKSALDVEVSGGLYRFCRIKVDLSRFWRQPVKTRLSLNGEFVSWARRVFALETKLALVQRLETGSTIVEVAPPFEVNPNVLHRWRREFRRGPRNAFPGFGKRPWNDTQQAKLEDRPADPGDRFRRGARDALRNIGCCRR